MLRRLRIAGFIALGALALVAVGVSVAYAFDSRAHEGEVARNVELASRPIGGLTRDQVAQVVDEIGGRLVGAPVRVDAPKGGFETTPEALGLTVDRAATIDAAFAAGRGGSLPGRVWGWARGYVSDRRSPLVVEVDEASVYRVVSEEDPGPRTEPVEPSIKLDGARFVGVDGEPGSGIDPADVIDALPQAARHGLPLRVEVDRGRIPPRFGIDDARALALVATTATDRKMKVIAGEVEAEVGAAQLRSWARAQPGPESLELGVDPDKAVADLAELLEDAGEPARETSFTVEGGQVRIVPGRAGTKCCRPEAADVIGAELNDPKVTSGPVRLPLAEAPPKLTADDAAKLGIVEEIATFETKHKAGEPRVKNIHRIADLTRGQVILPGKTFSVNNFIGRRTKEKGFVAAPVIEDGLFAEDVGGGISQYATTLFNAAFFGGLEFGEYQSHSIYISRYPYGREATLSFPHPDLEIENDTPYGVLIWPTYNSTSIRVTLYSTKHLEVTQTNQSSSPKGNCTRVRTERSIKEMKTGKTRTDSVFATYRPGEGINC